MKKRRSSPLGSNRSRQDGSSSDCAAEVGPSVHPAAGTPPEYPLKTRHLIMSQQGQNLLKFLNKDQTRQQFCDVMVSVGGSLYRAHKVVLAHGSSYFHAELSKNPAAEQVTLDHVEDSVFQHLLELLYTSECFVMEKDLPALTRAARFLDMMDVLKLLSGDGDRARVTQEEGGIGGAEVEATSGEAAAGEADVHSPGSLCSSGSGQVNTSDSPQSQSAQGQPDVCQETSAETEKTTTSTRRSTRRRRTPTKYQRSNVACANSTPGNAKEAPEEAEPRKPTEISTPAQETAVADEDEGGMNEDEACTADKQEGQPHSDAADRQTVPEVETRVAATGSSTQGPVYPEGLAPVIIQTSNKKTLKCPKCDKTFDRAGGKQMSFCNLKRMRTNLRNLAGKYQSHTRVHTGEKPFQCDVCLQRYSTKSNLTFHKKKHSSDAPFQKKEHTCPFCSKLHASKKTLSKHVRR